MTELQASISEVLKGGTFKYARYGDSIEFYYDKYPYCSDAVTDYLKTRSQRPDSYSMIMVSPEEHFSIISSWLTLRGPTGMAEISWQNSDIELIKEILKIPGRYPLRRKGQEE